MQDSFRQPKPFGRHFALDGPGFLISRRRHHAQTMRGVAGVVFVLAVLRKSHDFHSLASAQLGRVIAERSDAAGVTEKRWWVFGPGERLLGRLHL
jgi:hypothetical protein